VNPRTAGKVSLFRGEVGKQNGRHALAHAHRSATPVQSLAQPELARKTAGLAAEINLSAQRFRSDPQACKTFRMALLHSHSFWSLAFTSENHTCVIIINNNNNHQHNNCENPEVDATGVPENTRTWCD
jgi:hypothetical protein